jgi:hypothetical protein
MSLFEDTTPRALKGLLGEIHSRTMTLPDFQRDFVWEPGATQELIVSIANATLPMHQCVIKGPVLIILFQIKFILSLRCYFKFRNRAGTGLTPFPARVNTGD